MAIISIIVASMQGCGYKKAPYYEKEVDKKVKVIIKQPSKDQLLDSSEETQEDDGVVIIEEKN